ncbi:DUF7350 domain-containing protein [Natronorarus salvus]|uniref:DUF7350 domain-containing protein n=1 Tax=Natronorarus salvus TaxID=3117733 RepID=UPI002F25F730
MRRRDLLTAGAGGFALGLAGCLETLGFERRSAWQEPPIVEGRPDAVYIPASIEEMGVYGVAEGEEVVVALSYTFPHRFWTVTGRDAEMVDIGEEDMLHLMVSVWDRETETVLPTEAELVVEDAGGQRVGEWFLWPMLSQRMGFHYGDNASLPDDGEYTARIRLGSLAVERRGAFEGRFEGGESLEIPFTFDADDVYGLDFELIEEARRGEHGELDPMGGPGDGHGDHGDHGHDDHREPGDHGDHGHGDLPLSFLPDVEGMPGKHLGETESGDARFDAVLDGEYLAVSVRTPYNGYVIPLMALSVAVERDDETVVEEALSEAIDPEFGHHYGREVGELEPDDAVTVSVDAPPQVSRHDGYETAFLEMGDVEFEV